MLQKHFGLGGVVGGVGVLGFAGACCSVQCMLSAVSYPRAFLHIKVSLYIQ